MDYVNLKEALEGIKGSSFVGIDMETTLKLKGGKKNPMQGKVRKVVTGANTMVFSSTSSSNYESMVKRRMEKEGLDPDTFKVSKRAWGSRIENSCFIEHKNEKYLELFFMNPGKITYTLEGENIEKEDIEGLQESKSSGDQENKVIIRTVNVRNITSIRAKGQRI